MNVEQALRESLDRLAFHVVQPHGGYSGHDMIADLAASIEARLSPVDALGVVLDRTWKEAEEALPEGWVLAVASPNDPDLRPTYKAEAWNGDGGIVAGFASERGASPAEALTNLAARLREPSL